MDSAIGIDPGLTGGIAIRCERGTIVSPMGIKGGRIDGAWLRRWIEENLTKYDLSAQIFVEKVQAFPGQGVVSVFGFGYTAGIIEGVLQASGFRYQFIRPQEWKKEMGLVFPKDTLDKMQKKTAAYQLAQKLFPKLDLRASARSVNIHSGMADAVLIAECGFRRLCRQSEAHEASPQPDQRKPD